MTEKEFRDVANFTGLVFDEEDERCDQLTRIRAQGYDTVNEATDLDELRTLLANDRCNLRGAIRYSSGDVFAYFWTYATGH